MAKYENKTKVESTDISAFLATVSPAERQEEARRLVPIFTEVSGFAPRLWGPSIIGFGRYDYVYASGHSGSAAAVGFAPRKAELVLYIGAGNPGRDALLAGLGKHRLGKGCLYLRHLDDANEDALRALIAAGLADLRASWPVRAD